MSEMITVRRSELKGMIKEAVSEAFHDIGVRNDEAEHIDEAREDFRFIRRLRKGYDGAASKVGGAVILAMVSGLGWLLWIGTQAIFAAKTGAPPR